MKQFLVFILSLVYLVTSTGATMHTHFCMGKIADWSLWEKSEGTACSKCGMESAEQSEGCCSNESKWIKIEDDQKAALANFELTPLPDVGPDYIAGLNHPVYISEGSDLLPQSHAPPNISFFKIYKRICIFRI